MSAEPFLPERLTLDALREAVQDCRGCDLYERATQAVFGEGLLRAHLMIVGEQPGDEEDKKGHPFVGPAGRLLDKALAYAAIPRDEAYVTNAVKHFKWKEQRGKRRIHGTPSTYELNACFPWLREEIALVRPRLIVTLGASASKQLLGPKFKVTEHRGEPIRSEWADFIVPTVHPSSVLRAPDEERRREARDAFFRDFAIVGQLYRDILGVERPTELH